MAQALLAFAECLAPGFRQPPLLLRIGGERVGAPSGQRSLEVGGARLHLLLDRGVEPCLQLLEVATDRPAPCQASPQGKRPDDGEQAGGEPGCRNRELSLRLEREGDPRSRPCRTDRTCDDQQGPLAHSLERGSRERGRGHQDGGCEDELESSFDRHSPAS